MKLPYVAVVLAAVSVACPGHPAPPAAPVRTALVTRAEPAPNADSPPTAGGRSPAEKFAAGELVFGVYTIHDAAHCEVASWDATAAALGLDGAQVLDRELTIGDTGVAVGAMADGVEILVRSDHEWVDDFQPLIEDHGWEPWVMGVGSIEMTSFQIWGHMGVFPLVPDPRAVNNGAPRWQTFPTAAARVPELHRAVALRHVLIHR